MYDVSIIMPMAGNCKYRSYPVGNNFREKPGKGPGGLAFGRRLCYTENLKMILNFERVKETCP